jgi:hypothetical protein
VGDFWLLPELILNCESVNRGGYVFRWDFVKIFRARVIFIHETHYVFFDQFRTHSINLVNRVRHLIPRVETSVLALVVPEEHKKVLRIALRYSALDLVSLIVRHRPREDAILQSVHY